MVANAITARHTFNTHKMSNQPKCMYFTGFCCLLPLNLSYYTYSICMSRLETTYYLWMPWSVYKVCALVTPTNITYFANLTIPFQTSLC